MKLKHIAIGAGVVAATLGTSYVTSHQPSVLPTIPGAINASITQANIDQTICNPSWHGINPWTHLDTHGTGQERPPSSYTTALKKQQLAQYGWLDKNPADYEEDHLISLELGGNPTDPNNLWPESYKTTPNAKNKDSVENYLHKEVCQGTITLQEAQKEISTNWVEVYNTMSANE